MTPAQQAVLDVVDANEASAIIAVGKTNPSANTVNGTAARALVKAGVLEEFTGTDGPMVRRVHEVATQVSEKLPPAEALEASALFDAENGAHRSAVGMLRVFSARGNTYEGTVPGHVKRSRRAKGRAAKHARKAARR